MQSGTGSYWFKNDAWGRSWALDPLMVEMLLAAWGSNCCCFLAVFIKFVCFESLDFWEVSMTERGNQGELWVQCHSSVYRKQRILCFCQAYFTGIAGNFCLCTACVLLVTRHSTLTQLGHKFVACTVKGLVTRGNICRQLGGNQLQCMLQDHFGITQVIFLNIVLRSPKTKGEHQSENGFSS